MCLAIYKKAGAKVQKQHLANAFVANSDGAGFAAAVDGELVIKKGFFKFEDFFEAWKPFRKRAALIHFRMATHGDIGEKNCHPFPMLDGKYAMIHNGIINIDSTKEESDSSVFASLVIEKMLLAGVKLDCPALGYLIEEAVGSGNKIAVMDGTGKAVIWNKAEGHMEHGVWYSNSCYKYERMTYASHTAWDYDTATGRYLSKPAVAGPVLKQTADETSVLWDDLAEETWKELNPDRAGSSVDQIPESDLAFYRAHGFTEEQIIELTMRDGEYCG